MSEIFLKGDRKSKVFKIASSHLNQQASVLGWSVVVVPTGYQFITLPVQRIKPLLQSAPIVQQTFKAVSTTEK